MAVGSQKSIKFQESFLEFTTCLCHFSDIFHQNSSRIGSERITTRMGDMIMGELSAELKWVLGSIDTRLGYYERAELLASLRLGALGDVRDMLSQYIDPEMLDEVIEYLITNPGYLE